MPTRFEGWTQYWIVHDKKEWKKAWPQLVSDAALIASKTRVRLSRTGKDNAPPTISIDEGIVLNGATGSHAESFDIDIEGGSKGSCKTAHKPYDVVVTAILLRASQLVGKGIEVDSDGYWYDWRPARRLIAELWPDDDMVSPLGN